MCIKLGIKSLSLRVRHTCIYLSPNKLVATFPSKNVILSQVLAHSNLFDDKYVCVYDYNNFRPFYQSIMRIKFYLN